MMTTFFAFHLVVVRLKRGDWSDWTKKTVVERFLLMMVVERRETMVVEGFQRLLMRLV